MDSSSHDVIYGKSIYGQAAGKEMHDRIGELNEIISRNNKLLGTRTMDETSVVTGDIPHRTRKEAVLSRREAEEAKRSLELLIKEELDDIPELYKTSKGQSIFG